MRFTVERVRDGGTVTGGHILSDDFGFEATFAVAAVHITLGVEDGWLTRDEAHEMAAMILNASADA